MTWSFYSKKRHSCSIEDSIEDNGLNLLDDLINQIGQDYFVHKKRSKTANILANRLKMALLKKAGKTVDLEKFESFVKDRLNVDVKVTKNGFLLANEHWLDVVDIYNDSIESGEATIKTLIKKLNKLGLTDKSTIFLGSAGHEASEEFDTFVESL